MSIEPPRIPPSALALLAALGACGTPEFAVVPRIGTLELDGEIGLASGSVSAVNDVSDLGLEKDESVFSGSFDMKWGSPHLYVALSQSEHGGDGTLSADLMYEGTTIPAGTDVSSDLELALSQAVLTFDLLPTEIWELGLGFGVLAADFDLDVRSDSIGESIEAQEFVPIPVLALRGGVELGPFEVSALAMGIDAEIEDAEADVLDLDVQVRWVFSQDLIVGALAVGYRRVDLTLDYEDDDDNVVADLVLDGPYLGLVLGF
jgi:hypothetical protein